MKFFAALLFALLALSGVFALPAGTPQDDAEVIAVPKRRPISDDTDFHDFKGVIDTGSGYPFLQPNPHTFSFNLGFFDSFEDIFRRLRSRLWPLGASPGDDSSADNDDDSGESPFTFSLTPHVPKNGNTTSTVKVVDGHKVEVNETVYGDNNSVFKVRVVNIRPLESGEEVEETVTTNTDANNNNNDKPNTLQPLSPTNKVNPVTSAPTKKINEFVDDDESDEREALNKKNVDNEIDADIVGSQHTTTPSNSKALNDAADDQEMLPTENSEDIAFVTDNSLQAEDAEHTETMAEQQDTTTVSNVEEQRVSVLQEEQGQQQLLTHADLTIDNGNEETETAQLKEEEEEVPEVVVSDADDNEDNDDNNDDNENVENVEVPLPHSHREDIESSDDESAEPVEMNPTFNSEWDTIAEDLAQSNDAENALNNDIDVYDTIPIDLSNDIAVNDAAAADPNFQPNPDAEFFDVVDVDADSSITSSSGGRFNSMPKFEKLSLTPAMEPTSYQQDEPVTHELK